MSSDLFVYDDSFRCSPETFSTSDIDLQFLSDAYYHFPDPSLDILQPIFNDPIQQLPSDPIPIPLISSSPSNLKMQTLSLDPTTEAQGITDLGVKLEEFCMDPAPNDSLELIQRSFSSRSLDRKPGLRFQPHFSSLSESPKFLTQFANSIEINKFEGSMRRSCSTGDLQRMNGMQSNYAIPSPLPPENSYMEAVGSFRVGRYSPEERKQKILKYRSKRNQRNFNKTIKYACRKTLADSRPRVRGRFARNDETGETAKTSGSHREEEDEDEPWVRTQYFSGFLLHAQHVRGIQGSRRTFSVPGSISHKRTPPMPVYSQKHTSRCRWIKKRKGYKTERFEEMQC